MDSSNYSQTYNIQDIIDKIEEETNLTVPSAVTNTIETTQNRQP